MTVKILKNAEFAQLYTMYIIFISIYSVVFIEYLKGYVHVNF